MPINETCPLCLASEAAEFHRDKLRPYFKCPSCDLVFVPRLFHLTPREEMQRYEQHQNNPEDAAYRDFLLRLGAPLMQKLKPGSRGIDYGSGPGPTLSLILAEQGFPTEIYDPYFADNPGVLEKVYDFLTCTETVEHFRNPAKHWQKIYDLVKPGGWIGVMTSLITKDTDFKTWHYSRDDTHIAFYSTETMKWIAKRYELEMEIFGDSVVLMRKYEVRGTK